MKDAFEGIVGYEGIKSELRRIADVLINPAKYKKLGVKMPAGMIFEGEPGTGKTTMAISFIKMTGRSFYVCRKTRGDGEFLNGIEQIFEQAKQNAPSIVLLDDLDKFSDDECSHAEEFSAVQAGVDHVADNDVFVIATINESYSLPDSLMRSGRLGKHFEFTVPTTEEAQQIIQHYLENKQVDEQVNTMRLAKIMNGKSCADLENVVNEAGILAGYREHGKIREEDIIDAALNNIFLKTGCDEHPQISKNYHVACHEAGHVVVSELLGKGSVVLASIRANEKSEKGGFVQYYIQPQSEELDAENMVLRSLGGKAAIEIVYGIADTGAGQDIEHAFDISRSIVVDFCSFGFDKWNQNAIGATQVLERQNQSSAAYLEICYARVKCLLVRNRPFLDAVMNELLEKITLTDKDIAGIEQAMGIG